MDHRWDRRLGFWWIAEDQPEAPAILASHDGPRSYGELAGDAHQLVHLFRSVDAGAAIGVLVDNGNTIIECLSGKVVAKREEPTDDGAVRKVADLELHMINQRDTETAYASATVALPSHETGLPLFPQVPTDVARQAAEMVARHNELAAQRSRTT